MTECMRPDCVATVCDYEAQIADLKASWDKWCESMCVTLGMDKDYYGGTCKGTRFIETKVAELQAEKAKLERMVDLLCERLEEVDCCPGDEIIEECPSPATPEGCRRCWKKSMLRMGEKQASGVTDE